MKKIYKIVIAILILLPTFTFAARTDGLWDYIGNYYSPNGSANGADLLLKGPQHYLNFNAVTGVSGYGFRDNGGIMEYRNAGGSWAGIGTGGGGGGGSVTSVSATTPAALTVTGSPITTSGTLAFSLTSGYTIPLVASTTEWASKISSQWTSTTTGIYYNGGSVGIGTANPAYILETKTNDTSGAYFDVNGTTHIVNLGLKGNQGNNWWQVQANNSTSLIFSNINSGVTAMTLLSSGNVGIGMTPTQKFQVAGNSGNQSQYGGSFQLNLNEKVGTGGVVAWAYDLINTTTYNNNLVMDRGTVGVNLAPSNGGYTGTFNVGGTGYFSGNVAVGTTSLTYPLNVQGDTNQTGALRFNGSAGTAGQVPVSNGAGSPPTWTSTSSLGISGGGAVSSVSNSDGTLTISPTTGAVVSSLNLSRANTWTASTTFAGGVASDYFYSSTSPSTYFLNMNGGDSFLGGNLTLGTASNPSAFRLNVAGNGYFSGKTSIGTTSTTAVLNVGNSTNASARFSTPNVTAIYQAVDSGSLQQGTISATPIYTYTGNVFRTALLATGQFGIGLSSPTATLHIGGGNSQASRGTLGAFFNINNGAGNTATDTASTGTVGSANGSAIFGPTFAANSATTYTNASTLWIAGFPIAGPNVTITNPWSFYVNTGNSYFGGGITTTSYLQMASVNPNIFDSNGNKLIGFKNASGGINNLTIANGQASSTVVLGTEGADNNVGLNFSLKGNGYFAVGSTTPAYPFVFASSTNNSKFMSYDPNVTGTSTIYVGASGTPGQIILKDVTGAGCTAVTAQAGTLAASVITCPN